MSPRIGDLRIWWIPQVPGARFFVPVKDIEQAVLIYKTLAEYDKFQLEHNIKPDYSNVGGLEVFGSLEEQWSDWYDPDTDKEFSDVLEEE